MLTFTPMLEGFTDSSMYVDVDNSQSTSEYVMTCAWGVVLWQLRLQKVVALLITEVEYMVVVEDLEEIIWMKEFVGELGIRKGKFRLYYDNQSVVHLAKNAAYHSRTKHIQRRCHWLGEWVEEGEFALTKIHTLENKSDMLKKVLLAERLEACRSWVGLANSHPK